MEWMKKNKFWVIYAAVVLVFAMALTVGLAVLNSYLKAFEASQPIHVAEAVYARYFGKDSLEKALKEADFQTGEYETLKNVDSYIKTMRDGKHLSFYSVSVGDGKAVYNVVLTDSDLNKEKEAVTEEAETEELNATAIPSTKIATIYLKKSKEAGDFGLYSYAFDRLEFHVKGTKSIAVSIPDGYTLFVNGIAVEEDAVKEKTQHEWNAFLPEGVKGIEYLEFEVGDLFEEPTLTCQNADGEEMALVQDEESGAWKAELTYSEEKKEELGDRILAGMKEYAKFMQNDGRIGLVSPYFDRTSMFYKNTAANPSVFVWDHNGYSFRNEEVGEFYEFDEKTLCCHVQFEQVLKKTGREDYVDRLDMVVFVRKVGNSWLIYDRMVTQ